MVTFFCDNCGGTEKKKQAERHMGFCGGPMNCLGCREIFTDLPQIKAHTQCGNIPPKIRYIPQPNGKKVNFYEKHLENKVELTPEEQKLASKKKELLVIFRKIRWIQKCDEEVGKTRKK